MNDDWPMYYILVGRTPMAVDVLTWGRWFEDITRRKIGHDVINDRCSVSTVFLGMDHGWGRGDPILFETMIFGGPLHEDTTRYCTYADAERGHAEAVAQARIACAKVKSLAQQAGIT